MRLGYVNGIIEDQLVAATALSADYPIANVLDPLMIVKYKSLNSGSLNIDFRDDSIVGNGNVESISASICVINAHNMVSGDTASLKGYVDEDTGTPTVTYNFTLYEYGMAIIFDEADLFWEIDLSVTSAVTIGGIFLGEHLVTPAYEIGASTKHVTTDTSSKSKSGQLYSNEGYIERVANYLLPHLTEIEKPDWLTLWSTVRNSKSFYLLQYPDSQSIQPVFYCHFTMNSLDFQEHEGNRQVYKDVSIKIEEDF